MLEYPVSQLPPQDPNDYPYIKGSSSLKEGTYGPESPASLPSVPTTPATRGTDI